MAKVTATKTDIFTEELDFRSAVSEQLLTKIGSNIQFIHDRQMMVFDFRFLVLISRLLAFF